MNSSKQKRVTMKLKKPNPLFEQWLTEWRDDAIEKSSKMQHCYKTALTSLQRYPLELNSGRDCKILQGFGDKLCQMLDEKLQKHKSNNPPSSSSSCKNSPKPRVYVPTLRSGAYAILITLYKKSLEPLYAGHMLKVDIIKNGQHLCDKSFVKPDAGCFYTAWSSMRTLLDKNLVIKKGSPSKFSLTDEGLVLAHKLYKNNLDENPEVPQNEILHVEVVTNKKQKTKTKSALVKNNIEQETVQDLEILTQNSNNSEEPILSQSQEDTFIFAPYTFDIILLVDKQETTGQEDDPALSMLRNLSVRYELKHLKVGDYTWICRERFSNKELVLPYIIERKRMDDFGSSIKDGRFHEQKFRLKQSGIQNLIYLIESYGSNTHTGLPMPSLYQAATNTLIQDEFQIKFTESLRGTMEYLASFTSIIKNIYEGKTLVSCPKENLVQSSIKEDLISLMSFKEFNMGASKNKNFKVQELFVRQLVQLKGLSVEKAIAIVEQFPTPRLLYETYTSTNDGEKLLANILYGKLKKKIGPCVSKTIYQLFTSQKF